MNYYDETEMDVMQVTRSRLVQDRPWWGSLALRFKLVPTNTVPTAQTDGVTLWYNPTWFESKTEEERKGVVAHETSHCALGHPWRIGSRDLDIANQAADHVINLDLLEAGFELPKPFLADPRFKGMAFETVYSILADEKANANSNGNQKSPPAPENGTDETPGQAPDDQLANQGTRKASRPGIGGTPGGGGGAKGKETNPGYCPDVALGENGGIPATPPTQTKPINPTAMENSTNFGGIRPPTDDSREGVDGTGKTEDDLAYEWEKAADAATYVASKAGTMPGGLLRTFEESKRQREDLLETLMRYLTSAGMTSFAAPNKRMLHRGIVLPGRIKSGIDTIFFWVDTSGSISQPLLAFFKEKTNECLLMDTAPERIYVGYCDAKVHRVDEFTDGQIEFNPMGGGGTKFQPMFNRMEEEDIRPDVVVILTDLDGADNALLREPDFPVLWATPMSSNIEPPFGEVIRVDPYV